MIHDHNKNSIINLIMTLLQTDEEAMNDNINLLLLIPMKLM